VGAAFNLLIGGIPSVYYGQELGMFGKSGNHRFGTTDGNDIPMREAFEWYKADTGRGMAIWYKNTGPWWDSTDLKPNDGVSLQEEEFEPNSLWNWYRSLIHLHTSHVVFYAGKYADITNDNNQVFSFIRYTEDSTALVAVNLSDSLQQVNINLDGPLLKWDEKSTLINLSGNINPDINGGKIYLQMPPYSVQVWEKE
jgi:glycosidase